VDVDVASGALASRLRENWSVQEPVVAYSPDLLSMDADADSVATAVSKAMSSLDGAPSVLFSGHRYPFASIEYADTWLEIDIPRRETQALVESRCHVSAAIPSTISHHSETGLAVAAGLLIEPRNVSGTTASVERVRQFRFRLPAGSMSTGDKWILLARPAPGYARTVPLAAVFDHLVAGESPQDQMHRNAVRQASTNRTRTTPANFNVP